MTKAEASIDIERAVEDVFAYATDLDTWPLWAGEVVEQEQTTEGPLGVGTQFKGVGRFLGRRIEVVNEVSAFEQNASFAFRTISGPIKSHNTLTFESIEGGTRVTESIDAELGGFFGLADPLVARMAGRQFATNLGNMKDLLEAQAEGGTG